MNVPGAYVMRCAGACLWDSDTGDEIRAYQGVVESAGGFDARPRQLSQELELSRLTCFPQAVESGQPVRFTVTLRTFTPLTLDHLCLLLIPFRTFG